MPAGRVRGRRVDTTSGGTAMKKRGIAGLAFAAATAVALAFGANQALAVPAAEECTAERPCTDDYCRNVVCYPFPGVCQGGKCLCAGGDAES
jgi:hypothetical protein